MKDYSLYLVIMLLGLGTAYWASLPTVESSEEKVSIATILPTSVKNIQYLTPKVSMNVYPQENGRDFWIDFTKHAGAKESDTAKKDTEKDKEAAENIHHGHSHAHGENSDHPEDLGEEISETASANADPEKQEKFKASEKINDIVEGFNPFQGLRLIGQNLSDEELKEFGIIDSKEKLIITNKDGAEFTYILGSKSYGSRNRFLQDTQSSKVILVDGRPFESLERADFRLYERRLYDFNLDDVVSVDIKAKSQVTSLEHTTRDAKGELQWTNKGNVTTSKSSYESWINKIHRLRLMNFQVDEVRDKLKSTQPFLQISFNGKSSALGNLSFYRVTESQNSKSPANRYWVYSQFLGEFAELSANRMDPIEKDMESILDKP